MNDRTNLGESEIKENPDQPGLQDDESRQDQKGTTGPNNPDLQPTDQPIPPVSTNLVEEAELDSLAVGGDPAAPQGERYMFRHKTIRAFRLGPFQFDGHVLVIDKNRPTTGAVGMPSQTKENELEEKQVGRLSVSEKRDAFLIMCEGLKERDRNEIVEVDEEALRRMERPVSRAIRGAMSTGQTAAVPVGSGQGQGRVVQETDGSTRQPQQATVAKPSLGLNLGKRS